MLVSIRYWVQSCIDRHTYSEEQEAEDGCVHQQEEVLELEVLSPRGPQKEKKKA